MKSTSLSLSAIVITKNEEKNIKKCLRSLHFCDEIIIIDDYSTDKTREIAKRFTQKIYKHKLKNDFAGQRNYALQKSRGTWVLFIDADERVNTVLAREIVDTIRDNTHFSGFFLRRIDILWNKPMLYGELATFGAFGNGKLLRLAKRNAGKWTRKIHETWKVKGSVGTLKKPLYHYPHKTYTEFLTDISQRSEVHSCTIQREGKKSSLIKALIWPTGKFLYNYIYKLGFLDGERGFILAITMSFHSFISWSYLCLKQQHEN